MSAPPLFRLADERRETVVRDASMVRRVLDEDPALLRHPGLAEAIERRVGQQERAALAKN